LTCTLNAETTSLKQKLNHVLATETSRAAALNGKVNYYENLDKTDIIAELHTREVRLNMIPKFLIQLL